MSKASPDATFASGSVRVHLVRGVVGLVASVVAFALLGTVGPASLLLLVLAVLAWRGCPTCWALGLTQTKAVRASGDGCAACPPASATKVRHPASAE